jgi:SAM-dependent methyltransferase
LNLGCGTHRKLDMINCDLYRESGADVLFDLEKPHWPFPDACVEQVELSSVIEHVINSETLFKEIYRVCKHGAVINIIVPHPRHDWFLTDPTHVKAWHPDSFHHLDREECLGWYFSGSAKTPLAIYWNVDFKVANIDITVADSNLPTSLKNLGLAPNVDLSSVNRYFNNIAAEIRVTLLVRKA